MQLRFILFFLCLSSIHSYGQSKKKQIELLNGKLDSLNEVVSNERNNYTQTVLELKHRIDSLYGAVSDHVNDYTYMVQLKDAEIFSLYQEQSSLESRIDSLNQEIAELGITIPEDAITVYGVMKFQDQYDGDDYYYVEILEGSLTNVTTLWLYAGNTGEDINAVKCICPPFNDSDLEGEKFIAIVIKSERTSENMEYGGISTMPCYRPIFLKRL